MSKTLRIAVAAIAAIMLVGLAPLPTTTNQVDWQTADPSLPEGG